MTKQLFLILAFYVLPMHTTMMSDKGFNLFDECAARCVHLFPQEEHIWQHSKFTEDAN